MLRAAAHDPGVFDHEPDDVGLRTREGRVVAVVLGVRLELVRVMARGGVEMPGDLVVVGHTHDGGGQVTVGAEVAHVGLVRVRVRVRARVRARVRVRARARARARG